jgi:UDP-galactopyranose mutase
MQEVICLLAEHGIFCCGRFAEWRYYNMDAAIESAFNVTSKLSRHLG